MKFKDFFVPLGLNATNFILKFLAPTLMMLASLYCHGQMILSGTATGSCDCYTLTTAEANQAGSIWSPSTISLANPFDIKSRIFLGYSDGGADGMTFVLRQGGTFTGSSGGALGYGGILNSVAVEIDTWNNGGISGDIDADHLGLNSNGSLHHNLVAPVVIDNIENGVFHDFRVIWDPILLQMQVYLDGDSVFSYTADLVNTFFGGNPEVYFGWTAATGGATNLQQVCIDLEANFTADDFEVCPGQLISFTSTSTGGLNINNSDMVSYAWNFGGGVSELEHPTHSYLTEGAKIVTLTITNFIGCTATKTLYVTVDSIAIDLDSIPNTCFGNEDGHAIVTPITGDAPFVFSWDDPLEQSTATAFDLVAGIYTVTVTDNVGCIQTKSVEVTEPENLIINSIAIVNGTCERNNGIIAIEVTGGTLPYSYSIDGGVSSSPFPTFTDLASGEYSILVRDANGCEISDNITLINTFNLPEIVIDADTSEGCRSLEVNITNLSDPSLTAFINWNLGDGTLAEGGVVNHTYETAGCYDIHVDITTIDGCSTSADFFDYICVWELPVAEFYYLPEEPDVIKNTVQFTNQSSFASTFEWTFGDGGTSTLSDPIHPFPTVGTVSYPVQLIALSDNGCSDTANQIITVHEVVAYYIPNVFSPDGNAINAVFMPQFLQGFSPVDYHLVIFNRFGEMIWESNDINAGWNGTNGQINVPEGVYIWELKFRENSTDKRYAEYGHVTLIR